MDYTATQAHYNAADLTYKADIADEEPKYRPKRGCGAGCVICTGCRG
jgi:hypothetical protein